MSPLAAPPSQPPSDEDYEYTGPTPLNREPSASSLISTFITPPSLSYDRNHGPIPSINASTHTISVRGLVSKPLTLTISSLATDFPQHTITSILQCAGNRRHTMRTALKEVQGIDWFDAAVMNCTWTGPLLCDILSAVGITSLDSSSPTPNNKNDKKAKSGELHVAFASYQTPCQDSPYYGASIPLSHCLRRDASILLALSQNGTALIPAHGYPVRVIAPGICGARSVKWLDSITIQTEESSNFYQRRDYKILPPEAIDKESAKRFWDFTPALMELPVNSAIAEPRGRVERDVDGIVEVKGYALPKGSEGPVVRVEVRVDGGCWGEAELLGEKSVEGGKECEGGNWAWCLWVWKGVVEKGRHTIWSRATDRGGNMQMVERSEWNLRGVAYNGYGEAVVDVV